MTLNEKINKLLQNRVNSLVSLKGVSDAEVSFNEEADFHNEYLFGDGTNLGVVNFLELYYRELNLAVGRTATSPSLHAGLGTTKNSWITRFQSAVTLAGDGSLYPDSNADGVADDQINQTSAWLYNNGDQRQSTPLTEPLRSSFVSSIAGSVATDASDGRTSAYVYNTEPEALAAGQARADADNGVGLLGKRTQNADSSDTAPEITTEQDAALPNLWRYIVGSGGVDHLDYYNEPEKTNLENNLSSAVSVLQAYYDHLLTVEAAIQDLDAGNNTLFSESGMSSDIDTASELTNISSQKGNIQSLIIAFQGELGYFSSFTAGDDISGQVGYNRTTFNNKLSSIIPGLYNDANSHLSSRILEVEAIIGYENPSASFRKWLYFWVTQNIAKPTSPYVGLGGISTARSSQISSLSNSNAALNDLFGDSSQYLPTPSLVGTFLNPKINDSGVILQQRVNLLWLGSPAANKYKIFRKRKADLVSFSNDNWTDADFLDWQVSLNPDSGSIEIKYLDTSFVSGEQYVYRVQMFDSSSDGPASSLQRIDSFDSSSLQSKIFDDENEISVSSIVDGRMTVFEGHGLSRGGWILIRSDDLLVEDFFQIEAATEDIIVITDSITLGSSKIYKAFGVVRIP